MQKLEKMKTGQKKSSGKLTPLGEYINMLNENGRKGPATWIVVSPRVAEELNKLKNNKGNGRK
ncbi:hypothetical protein UFOVP1247_265 [uncultured Caudovirales phage]|uniref:Uncharacterized protein n=1 Tax=uncultured Caudovirales phage TaxID=2100421 RepID=A0A6J5Q2P5_9CAUD|nr:hypothetical protein UFOVP970_305 [uncultured Caudovirales phage]CAB4193894.1 hypothetical protein UFOVP1247_265 [uncultured Caudovirales phage]